jgi:hypothetical protein
LIFVLRGNEYIRLVSQLFVHQHHLHWYTTKRQLMSVISLSLSVCLSLSLSLSLYHSLSLVWIDRTKWVWKNFEKKGEKWVNSNHTQHLKGYRTRRLNLLKMTRVLGDCYKVRMKKTIDIISCEHQEAVLVRYDEEFDLKWNRVYEMEWKESIMIIQMWFDFVRSGRDTRVNDKTRNNEDIFQSNHSLQSVQRFQNANFLILRP